MKMSVSLSKSNQLKKNSKILDVNSNILHKKHFIRIRNTERGYLKEIKFERLQYISFAKNIKVHTKEGLK